jgi:hypothetical protein
LRIIKATLFINTRRRHCIEPSYQAEYGILNALAVSNKMDSEIQKKMYLFAWLKPPEELGTRQNTAASVNDVATLVQGSPALMDSFAKKYTCNLTDT